MKSNKSKQAPIEQITNYTAYVSQELNDKVSIAKQKEAVIEAAIQDVTIAIKELGDRGDLVRVINELREKQMVAQKETVMTALDFKVDLELSIIAKQIDQADARIKGNNLMVALVPSYSRITSQLQELGGIYQGIGDVPYSLTAAAHMTTSIIRTLEADIQNLHRPNKVLLIKKLHERMDILEALKIKAKKGVYEEKYTELIQSKE